VLSRCVFTELGAFDGKDGRPLYVGAHGLVFDVGALRRGWDAYGPTGGYNVFSAADASWALASMCLEPQDKWPAHPKFEDLSTDEQSTLADWVDKFQNFYSYPVVGWIRDGFFPREGLP
jgi:predicted heme/steroid binding protein